MDLIFILIIVALYAATHWLIWALSRLGGGVHLGRVERLTQGDLEAGFLRLASPAFRESAARSASRAIDGRGCAPHVCVVMHHPAAGSIHRPGGFRAGLGQILHHRHERFDALRQVARLRRPIIHLRVDVDRVLTAPWRVHAVIPNPL